MERQYRIHFGVSKSKRYQQALELASRAHKHEIRSSRPDSWHILTFTEEQIDLMALVYSAVRGFHCPKVDGVDVRKLLSYGKREYYDERVRSVAQRLMTGNNLTPSQLAAYIQETYLTPISEDMGHVYNRLASEGYIETFDQKAGAPIKPRLKPQEQNPIYAEIRGLISGGQYTEAINKYYETLGNKPYGELHQELLYLKRLGNVQISGRDILAFRNESSRSDLIKENLWEYCSCIDSVLETFRSAGRTSPLEILVKSVPTLEELAERTQRWLNKGVYLWDGELKRDKTTVTVDFFGTFQCPKGRLFDRYPNPLIYHRDEEEAPAYVFLPALWTTYKPSFVEEEILRGGLHLSGIEAYKHRRWRLWASKKREPDFSSLQSLEDVDISNYGVSGIRYTGRTHQIRNKDFYEINLLRKAPWNIKRSLPSLEEFAEDVLREAENLIRERHGLPRIGEGWVSEMQLYNLVKEVFPDAQHHVISAWLKPQELDVYVPSKKLAFEYQGIQHYEPLEFFGGKEALDRRRSLDERKKRQCRSNGIVLIEWRFDEPIDRALFLQKIKAVKVEP